MKKFVISAIIFILIVISVVGFLIFVTPNIWRNGENLIFESPVDITPFTQYNLQIEKNNKIFNVNGSGALTVCKNNFDDNITLANDVSNYITDGKTIYYTMINSSELYRMNADGSKLQVIEENMEYNLLTCWNNELIYCTKDDETYVMDINTSEISLFQKNKCNKMIAYRGKIYFTYASSIPSSGLYVSELDGSNAVLLMEDVCDFRIIDGELYYAKCDEAFLYECYNFHMEKSDIEGNNAERISGEVYYSCSLLIKKDRVTVEKLRNVEDVIYTTSFFSEEDPDFTKIDRFNMTEEYEYALLCAAEYGWAITLGYRESLIMAAEEFFERSEYCEGKPYEYLDNPENFPGIKYRVDADLFDWYMENIFHCVPSKTFRQYEYYSGNYFYFSSLGRCSLVEDIRVNSAVRVTSDLIYFDCTVYEEYDSERNMRVLLGETYRDGKKFYSFEKISEEGFSPYVDGNNVRPEISVSIDKNYVSFDQRPITDSGEILVPVREVLEALGYEVEMDSEKKQIIIKNKDTTLVCNVGDVSYEEYIGDERKEYTFKVAPQAVKGNVFVPIEEICEVLKYTTAWDEYNRCIEIYTNK